MMRARKLFVLPGVIAIVLAAALAPRLSHAAIYPHSGGAGSPSTSCVVDVWSVVPSANNGTTANALNGVAAVSAHDIWAVGWYQNNSTSTQQTLIEHWNGARWSLVPSANVGTGNSVLTQVAAIALNDVWAVGYWDGNGLATLTEHWNGSVWSVVASPNVGVSGSLLFGVAAVSTKDVWAVGYYFDDATLTHKSLIEQWNGSAWSVVTSANGSRPVPNSSMPGNNYLYAVTAVSGSDVWAVGMFTSTTGDQPLIENWNGLTWSLVPGAIPSSSTANQLLGVAAISAGNVVGVGSYSNRNNLTLAEQWNGTQWSVVATGNRSSTNNDGLGSVARVPVTGGTGRWEPRQVKVPSHTGGRRIG